MSNPEITRACRLSILEWMRHRPEFTAKGENALAATVIADFVSVYPEHHHGGNEVKAWAMLDMIARAAGFDDASRLIGSGLCGLDGSRSLFLDVRDPEAFE